MKTFEIVLSEERHVSMTMYLNLESKEFHFQKRPLIVVLPGGGYAMCSDREAEVVALQYMSAGYQACVLRYTLKSKGGWPYPINDYDECIETIAENAGEWNIDISRIVTVGFSAGGHLAACTATVAKHKPRAAVCVYPAILPEIVDACQPGMPYPVECVDRNTSPCFLVAARDDGIVNVNNTLAFAQALEKAGITFETHIYSYGGHGFSVGSPLMVNSSITSRAQRWVSDSIGWLGELMGEFTDNGFTKAVLSPRLNADDEPYLSVRCSIKHILTQAAAQEVLVPMYDGIRVRAEAMGIPFEALCAGIAAYKVREILEVVQIPKETIEQMDAQLNQIPNQL